VPKRKYRRRTACLALILGVAPAVVIARQADDCRQAAIHAGKSTRDRIELQQDGNAILLDIHLVTGIGNAILQLPALDHPVAVAVRLHAFPALEGFSVRGPNAAFECEQERQDGLRARLVCRIGANEIDAVRYEPGFIEVILPPALLESGAPVVILWIDQWR
jgi:hypothetical protein